MVLVRNTWSRVTAVLRHQPGDVESAHGRSRERLRRMALTSAASLAARAVAVLASLVSVPLTFRYLGAERYGLWMVLNSLILFLGVADLGIGNGVVNAVSEAYGKNDQRLAKEYVTSAFVLLFIIAFLLLAAGITLYPFAPWKRILNVESASVATEGAKASLVLFIWFIVSLPLSVVARAQAGLQRAYWSQIVGACGNVISLVALFVVVAVRGNLPLLVFASTLGTIIATLWNTWLLFEEFPWLLPSRDAWNRDSALKVLRLGLAFSALQWGSAIGFTSDSVIITQILGAAAVAVYAVPQKLFSVLSLLVMIGVGPIWPAYGEAIARGDGWWVVKTFWRSLRVVLVLTIPACIFLITAGPWIIRVAMGKTLHVPMSLLVCFGIWGTIVAVSTALAMLLNGAGVLKAQAFTAIAASLGNLALSILFTRKFGIIGVCLGSIISQIVITLPVCFFLTRNLFRNLAQSPCMKTVAVNVSGNTPS